MPWLLKTLARIVGDMAKFRSAKLQFRPDLSHSAMIDGEYFSTLENAAYALRQYSINHDDYEGWRISRLLREADAPLRAQLAEAKLRAWIRSRRFDHEPAAPSLSMVFDVGFPDRYSARDAGRNTPRPALRDNSADPGSPAR